MEQSIVGSGKDSETANPYAEESLEADANLEFGLQSPAIRVDADVVPIDEKVETINLEKANDAATEEAVVPFADKGLLFYVYL